MGEGRRSCRWPHARPIRIVEATTGASRPNVSFLRDGHLAGDRTDSSTCHSRDAFAPASNSAAFRDGMGFDFGQSLPVDQRTDRHSGAKPSPTISGGLSPRTLDKHLRERLTGRG